MRHDQWGRGSQDDREGGSRNNPDAQPPDLDKLWKDFTIKLNRFFNKKDAPDEEPPEEEEAGSAGSKIGFGLIAMFILGFWMASGLFIVQEGQGGVVLTFGKFSHMASSGFNWRWPYPIQSHEVVSVAQVRTIEVGYRNTVKNKQPKEALMLTRDESIADIQFEVQYRLNNAADWVFNNRDREEMARQVAETAVREIVGRNDLDYVLYQGRDKLASDAQKRMQDIFDQYRSGVQVTNVTMREVQPPEQVQAAFDDAVKAGVDRERQRNDGQAYANEVIPKARGAASRLLQEAEGYRQRVVANAEGDASRFKQVLAEYQKAPAVTRDRMYLETMQQIFSNTAKMMVDTKSGNAMLYMPLDKLIAQTGAANGNAGASSGNPDSAAGSAAPASPRVRETRERESR